MSNSNNPFSDLVRNKKDMQQEAREVFAKILRKYVRILRDEKDIIFLKRTRNLSASEIILLVFMVRFAMSDLRIINKPTMASQELIKTLLKRGVPEGTVKPTLMKLRERGYVEKVARGEYQISLSYADVIADQFKETDPDDLPF